MGGFFIYDTFTLIMNLKDNLNKLFLVLFLVVHFIPDFGAIDSNATEFVYLALLNSIVFIYFLFSKTLYKTFHTAGIYPVLAYFIYCIIAGISILFSININESLITLSQELIFLFTMFNIYLIFNSLDKNINSFLLYVLAIILTFELIAVFQPIVKDLIAGRDLFRSNDYKGFGGNINIATFSILCKIPVLIYLKFKHTKKNVLTLELMFNSLIILGILTPLYLGTRAGYLGSALIGIIYLIYLFSLRNLKKAIFILFLLLTSIIISVNILASYSSGGSGASLNVIERASTISLSTKDGSVNQRLRYYQHAIDSFLNNPLTGTGIGNWKLVSIKYDKDDINSYIIPYHAHNDLLQVLVETGFFGFIFYFIFIFITVYFLFKRFFRKKNESLSFIFLLSFFMVYSIDMMLNFPKARPINQVFLIFTIIYTNKYFLINELYLNKYYVKKYILIITVILSLITIYPSIKLLKSYQEQVFLAYDWANNMAVFPWEKIKEFEDNFPNLSNTGLPIKVMKARYLIKDRDFSNAYILLNESLKENPFLGVQENLKAQGFIQEGNIDSAFVNAKRAYFKLQNNSVHLATYFILLGELGMEKELQTVFENRKHKDFDFWINYLEALIKIRGHGDSELILYINNLKLEYPNNTEIFKLEKRIKIGEQNILLAQNAAIKANKLFDENRLEESLKEFEIALKIDNTQYTYLEDMGVISFKLDQYNNALNYFNKVLNDYSPEDGKAEFYKAIILLDKNYEKQDKQSACDLLKISLSKDFKASREVLKRYCL